MKKTGIVALVAFFILFSEFVQSQPAKWEPEGLPDALRIVSGKNGEEVVEEARYGGWRLSQLSIGPYLVEDLEMVPDPVKPGQEVRFNLKLRNSGIPVHANIRIEDEDKIVAQLDNVLVELGIGEYQFPNTGYFLQRINHCFIVVIEMEGRLYKAETTRELCTKSLGCYYCTN